MLCKAWGIQPQISRKLFCQQMSSVTSLFKLLSCAPESFISELQKMGARLTYRWSSRASLMFRPWEIWTHHNLVFSICKRNQPLLCSCEDRKSLIWQRSAAICLGWAREQNTGTCIFAQTLYLAEMRAAENEGEGPSQSKVRALQSLPMPSHGFSRKETWEHGHTACGRPSKSGWSRVRIPAHPDS